MLLLHNTSQVATDKHQNLLREKGGRGFPYLIWMDDEGTVLLQQGGRSVADFEQSLAKVGAFCALKKKAADGDKEAANELFVVEVELGKTNAAAAREKAPTLQLSDALKARLDKALVTAEIRDLFETPVRSQDERNAIVQKLYGLYKAGKKPGDDDEQLYLNYWALVLEAAKTDKNVAAFEEGYTNLAAKLASNPRAQRFLEQQKAELEKLKAENKPGSGE